LTGTETGLSGAEISYSLDYDWFFADNTVYVGGLAAASAVFSAVIYKDNLFNGMDIDGLMAFHGMENIERFNLRGRYDDIHLSEIAAGHINVNSKTVILAVIRGTDSSFEEWASNLDVGNPADFAKHRDWQNINNHKGFDITANRLHGFLADYIERYAKGDFALWITGHSRGGAIANILGARFEDEGTETYTYTFAAPNTTTARAEPNKYGTVFNIVNSDDFIPFLPLEDWRFTKYGRTASVSIASNEIYAEEWRQITGLSRYRANNDAGEAALKALASIADWINAETAVNRVFKSVINSRFAVRRFNRLNLTERFESVDVLAVLNALNLAHAHYKEGYYLLADKITESDFIIHSNANSPAETGERTQRANSVILPYNAPNSTTF
jgi:hypothetical protein